MALSLNPDEIDALYTLGVVQMALGDEAGAAASFAHVMRTRGHKGTAGAARAARESLMTLYGAAISGISFDDYVSSLRWTPPKPPDRAPSPAAGAYAGSTACRECHAPVYEQWQSTGMAKMFRAYRAADVIGDFSAGQTVVEPRAPHDAGRPALHRNP